MTETTSTDDAPTTGQKFAAELLGTFVLVFFGCGAAVVSGGDYITTGLTFGLTVVVMAYAVGRVSGGHFNPAVTLGAVLGGRLPWNAVPIYMGAQLVGGLLAGAALFGLLHGSPAFNAGDAIGANGFGDRSNLNFAMWAAFALEALMTLIFLYVILAVTDERNEYQALMAPLAIGFALAMIHFASMGATGTSVNPARSIGVGVFGGTDAAIQLWLFILAPLVGAAIAGLTYPIIFGATEPVAGSGLNFGGGKKNQSYAPPVGYEQQWNQGQQHPQQAWGQQPAPQQQGWGQPPAPAAPAPAQAWGQPQPPAQPPAQAPVAQPVAPPPAQPGPPPAQPAPQQWGQPAADPYAAPPAQAAPQEWGRPVEDDDEDGRTQVRRPD